MIIHQMQQRTPEWEQIRLGIPTASEFSRLCTSTGEPSKSLAGYAKQLAAEKFAGTSLGSWGGNVAMERGRFLEEDGIRAYQFARDVALELVGFITDDEITYGCSPDALVGDDGCCEVKCLNAEKHIATMMRHREKGDIPPEFVQQTQGQIMIAERKWCDLIFYHPQLPLLIIRQEPIPAVVSGIMEGIAKVLKERDYVYGILTSSRAA